VVALTNGGPGVSSDLPSVFMFDMAFRRTNLGLSAASAVVMLGTVLAILIPYLYARNEGARLMPARQTQSPRKIRLADAAAAQGHPDAGISLFSSGHRRPVLRGPALHPAQHVLQDDAGDPVRRADGPAAGTNRPALGHRLGRGLHRHHLRRPQGLLRQLDADDHPRRADLGDDRRHQRLRAGQVAVSGARFVFAALVAGNFVPFQVVLAPVAVTLARSACSAR
jgi:carbohydrate ABC transporter membrane protein 1, CUT1 family (TC 3.A.1.1.-)